MRLKTFLNEAKKQNLKVGIRKKMNAEIQKFLKPTYFKKIPLQPLFDILGKYGVVVLMEDNTEWDGFLMGGVDKTEMVHFRLGFKESEYNTNFGGKGYEPIENAMLVLTYYKMPNSGKYEIVSYVS